MNHSNNHTLRIILLVEDEESLRRAIAFTLMRHGFNVVPYGSVQDALEFLDSAGNMRQIILIITDLLMPGKNGLEIIRRAEELGGTIPVLVISGHVTRSLRTDLEHRGVNILDKPFDLDELVTKVHDIIAVKFT